jgi:TQXA domain-containing protein
MVTTVLSGVSVSAAGSYSSGSSFYGFYTRINANYAGNVLTATGVADPAFAKTNQEMIRVLSPEDYATLDLTNFDDGKSTVTENQARTMGKAAYCMYAAATYPTQLIRVTASNPATSYTRKTVTSESDLKGYCNKPQDNLAAGLSAVLYNGYPNNASGIQEKYGLSNEAFYEATQCAVWYYTSGSSSANNKLTSTAAGAVDELIASSASSTSTTFYVYDSGDASKQFLLEAVGTEPGVTPSTEDTESTEKEATKFPVKFQKVKVVDGENVGLAGASIEIRKDSKDGEVVESFTSTGTVQIYNLAPGTYTFVETKAPDGFDIADPITFTVSDTGKVTK